MFCTLNFANEKERVRVRSKVLIKETKLKYNIQYYLMYPNITVALLVINTTGQSFDDVPILCTLTTAITGWAALRWVSYTGTVYSEQTQRAVPSRSAALQGLLQVKYLILISVSYTHLSVTTTTYFSPSQIWRVAVRELAGSKFWIKQSSCLYMSQGKTWEIVSLSMLNYTSGPKHSSLLAPCCFQEWYIIEVTQEGNTR